MEALDFAGLRSPCRWTLAKETEAMKCVNRRKLGWALAAASGLGLTLTAAAKIEPLGPALTTPVKEAIDKPATLVRSDHSDRLAETRVVLAWLANPATFALSLDLKNTGTALEISGDVPTEAVRQQVLKTAHNESGMRVVDGLRLNPRHVAAVSRVPSATLHHQIVEILRHALPRESDGITVDVGPKGQVLLKGSVPTYREKLAASLCLHGMPGCSCVVNQLGVLTGTASKPLTSYHPQPGPVVAAETTVHPPSSPAPLQKPQLESQGLVQARYVQPMEKPEEAAISPVTPTSIQPATTTVPATPAKAAGKEAKGELQIRTYPTKWRRLGSEPAVSTATEAPAAKSPAIAANSTPKQSLVVEGEQARKPSLWARIGGQASSPPAVTKEKVPPGQGVIQAEYVVETKTPAKAAPAPAKSNGTSVAAPATSAKPNTELAAPVGVQGVKWEAPAPSTNPGVKSPAAPARSSGSAEATGGGYVSSGVVVFESTETAVQPSRPARLAWHGSVQQKIATACHKKVQDVEVSPLSKTELLIRVKAHNKDEADHIANQIFQMPELTPYQVSLETPLVP
jgi:hypothetical protein